MTVHSCGPEIATNSGLSNATRCPDVNMQQHNLKMGQGFRLCVLGTNHHISCNDVIGTQIIFFQAFNKMLCKIVTFATNGAAYLRLDNELRGKVLILPQF